MNDVFIRGLINLPTTVRGVTVKDENDDYNVYINKNLCPEKQKAAIQHELNHIKKDHLFSHSKTAMQCESEVL